MKKIFSSFNRCLILCFAFVAAMLAARIYFTGHIQFLFLVWNLFLAFIPYTVSLLFDEKYFAKRSAQILLFSVWLLFFPNALYIITDIIHLGISENVPLWYDAVLLFSSSFIGLAMAFVSLANAEYFLRRILPVRFIKPAVFCILFLGSFGVYLGRFERWNSWDIIRDPFSLAMHIVANVVSPFEHYRTWGVTILFTALYYVFWTLLRAFPTMHKETAE